MMTQGPAILQRLASVTGAAVCLALVAVWVVFWSPSVAAQADGTRPSGADLYARQCVSCHGVSASGVADRGPSLLEEGPAAVDFVLRTGRMPLASQAAQAGRRPTRYTEPEIAALVDYVGNLGSGPDIPAVQPSAGDVAAGGVVFRLNCAACHVATGAGSVVGSDRRAPSLADATAVEIGEAIIVGPGAMPVFADLTPQQIDDIAAYIKVLQEDGTTTASGLGGVGPVAEGLAAWMLGLVPLIAITRWIGRGRTDAEPTHDSGSAGAP